MNDVPARPLNVVFIHLGTRVPKYLIKNLARTRNMLGQGYLVTLVSDQHSARSLAAAAGVNFFLYTRNGIPWPSPRRDLKFRSGYWLHTIERFEALSEFHQTMACETDVLLIESDVIVFRKFPWERLRSFSKLAWTTAGEGVDVGALLYSPNEDQTRKLVSTLRRLCELNPELTDMMALYLARKDKALSGQWIQLPIWRKEFTQTNLSASEFPFEVDPKFDGIFDGSHLGTWASGGDPHSFWGFERRFHLTKQLIKQIDIDLINSHLAYRNGQLYIINSGISFAVFNLHVHSKNIRFFNGDSELIKLARQSQKNTVVIRFRFLALLKFIRTWIGIYSRGFRRSMKAIVLRKDLT